MNLIWKKVCLGEKKINVFENFPHSTGISSNCNFLQFIWGWKRISLSFTNFRALWTLLERGPTDWQNWFASLISWASELAKVLKREREIRKAEEGENHKLLLQYVMMMFSSLRTSINLQLFQTQLDQFSQINTMKLDRKTTLGWCIVALKICKIVQKKCTCHQKNSVIKWNRMRYLFNSNLILKFHFFLF